MKANKQVAKVIEGVLREIFPEAEIDSVRVLVRLDHEGDEIFDVSVVYNVGPLDPRKTVGIIGDVRRKLRTIDVDTFPIFSFISKSDLKRSKPEAA
jgi:hypothetical protein